MTVLVPLHLVHHGARQPGLCDSGHRLRRSLLESRSIIDFVGSAIMPRLVVSRPHRSNASILLLLGISIFSRLLEPSPRWNNDIVRPILKTEDYRPGTEGQLLAVRAELSCDARERMLTRIWCHRLHDAAEPARHASSRGYPVERGCGCCCGVVVHRTPLMLHRTSILLRLPGLLLTARHRRDLAENAHRLPEAVLGNPAVRDVPDFDCGESGTTSASSVQESKGIHWSGRRRFETRQAP